MQDKILQPSRKHYGGQGYAKASVFLPLTEPDFAERFGVLWDEHIQGFSGKVCASISNSCLADVFAQA